VRADRPLRVIGPGDQEVHGHQRGLRAFCVDAGATAEGPGRRGLRRRCLPSESRTVRRRRRLPLAGRETRPSRAPRDGRRGIPVARRRSPPGSSLRRRHIREQIVVFRHGLEWGEVRPRGITSAVRGTAPTACGGTSSLRQAAHVAARSKARSAGCRQNAPDRADVRRARD
jgi:hypothetical protein